MLRRGTTAHLYQAPTKAKLQHQGNKKTKTASHANEPTSDPTVPIAPFSASWVHIAYTLSLSPKPQVSGTHKQARTLVGLQPLGRVPGRQTKTLKKINTKMYGTRKESSVKVRKG